MFQGLPEKIKKYFVYRLYKNILSDNVRCNIGKEESGNNSSTKIQN